MNSKTEKYPRTYHLSFSPEIHGDDKVIHDKYLGHFLDTEIVISEKIDGGNCAIVLNDGVFARSHAQATSCPTFDYIKNVHYFAKMHLLNPDYKYFGENMFAIHSIEYTNLEDYFYLFNILDSKKGVWLDWEGVVKEAERLGFKTVPVRFKGKVSSILEVKDFMDKEILNESVLGGNCEGFVLRIAGEVQAEDFSQYFAKYVRHGHVQTD